MTSKDQTTPPADGPMGALVKALADAQAAFPELKKTKTAKVTTTKGNYEYSYADLADVLATVRPVLAAHGLALVQRTVYGDNGRLLLRTELLHAAGGQLHSEVAIEQNPGNAQQFGGALTYMRRYALVTLLGIQADEDLDAQQVESKTGGAVNQPAELPKWANPASEARKKQLLDRLSPMFGADVVKTVGTNVTNSVGYMPDGFVGFALALVGMVEQQAATTDAARDAQDQLAEQPDTPADGNEAAVLDGLAELGAEDISPGTVPLPDLPKDPALAFGTLKAAGCTCDDPLGVRSETPKLDETCPIVGHGIPF